MEVIMKKGLFLYFITMPLLICAQNIEQGGFTVKFGGFIKNDFFYDTRQVVAAREGHFLLWPAKPSFDQDGHDINDVPSLNFLSIQTRLNASFTAPEVKGFKITGMVEGAFFGHSNPDINGFRLRHAFVRLQRNSSEFLFGQFWNPLFITSAFPDVVSFNTGVPFQPFSRNPQIRYTFSANGISLVAAALSQRDFANVGPAGSSSVYLRNAATPDLHLQLHYKLSKPENTVSLTTGAAIAWKKIVPELVTPQGYQTNASVSGTSYSGYVRLDLPSLIVKTQYILGQNTNDLLMIGGYGVIQETDQVRGIMEYAPLKTQQIWLEAHTTGKVLQSGIFIAVSENRGATADLLPGTTVTGLGTDIKSLFRVSPRVLYNLGKARFALECEYTRAAFGTVNIDQNSRGIPVDVNDVANLRLLFAVYYFI
jgi:hypothetical protein